MPRNRAAPVTELFAPAHRRTTALCLLAAVAALFVAQVPNDTRSEWFRGLARPDVLPRELERKIGLIWTAIFLLAGLGAAAALAAPDRRRWKRAVVGLTLAALGLNLTYTYTFTRLRDLPTATWIAAALAATVAALIAVAWAGRGRVTAACHLPHLLWVCFATYVTARMSQLNPGP